MEKFITRNNETQPTAMASQPELLTRKEISKLLKISLVTLDLWTKKGIVPFRTLGSRKRYMLSEVISSMQQGEPEKYVRV